MADPRDKVAGSVAGDFYVDTQCIDCDVCRVTAPGNFQRDENRGFSFVFRQPGTPDERARCEEAMDSCPVEAIGSDGEAILAAIQPGSARK
ncbi:MAG: ferredoxin [Thermoanaerobaculia bacterium]